jgi:replicative DNA helicase
MNENKSVLTIPHDFEAEEAVLGAIILDNKMIFEAMSILTPNSFHDEHHRHIYRAMLELVDANQPIDEILLGDQLKELGKLDDIGGYAHLAELADCVPSSGNFTYHVRIVQEHAIARDFITKTSDLSRKGRDVTISIKQLLDEADESFRSIRKNTVTEDYVLIKDAMQNAFQKLEDVSKNKSEVTGLPTGFMDLDRITSGLHPSDLIILAARPSMGKGLNLDEPVLMESGLFVKNENLKVGDRIASIDGEENIVTGVFRKGLVDFYRVTFKDGRFIDCDFEHKWTISSSKWNHKPRTVGIKKLHDLITKRVRYKGRIYTVPISGDFGCIHDIGINPWILGALLGDGCLTGGCLRFSNSEQYMLEKFKRLFSGKIKRVGDKYDYRLTFNKKISPELEFIRKHGLSGKKSPEKFIPEIIFKSSKHVREQVLAGLLETDGWVEKYHSFLFASASERLRDDVARLVYSLGGSASKTLKEKVFYSYKGKLLKGLPSYKLCINLSEYHFLESPRILKNFKQRAIPYPKIVNVEYIGKKESQCISVSHKAGLFCVGDYIMTHNTALALNISSYIATRNVTKGAVLIFTMEMSIEQCVMRMLTSESKIDSQKLRTGNLETSDWDRLAGAADRLSVAPIYINDNVLTISEVRAIATKLHRQLKHGLSLVVIDYLQLMASSNKGSREQEVSEMATGSKQLAKDLHIPVLALSQLNRALENRTDKRPKLADLRESGTLEQAGDIILFIYRDEIYYEDSEHKGTAEIIIGKHRNGPIGKIELAYVGKHVKFASLSKIEPYSNVK